MVNEYQETLRNADEVLGSLFPASHLEEFVRRLMASDVVWHADAPQTVSYPPFGEVPKPASAAILISIRQALVPLLSDVYNEGTRSDIEDDAFEADERTPFTEKQLFQLAFIDEEIFRDIVNTLNEYMQRHPEATRRNAVHWLYALLTISNHASMESANASASPSNAENALRYTTAASLMHAVFDPDQDAA